MKENVEEFKSGRIKYYRIHIPELKIKFILSRNQLLRIRKERIAKLMVDFFKV